MQTNLTEIVTRHEERLNVQEAQLQALHSTVKEVSTALTTLATATTEEAKFLQAQTAVLEDLKDAVKTNNQMTQSFIAVIRLLVVVLVVVVITSFIFISVIFNKVDGNALIEKVSKVAKEIPLIE